MELGNEAQWAGTLLGALSLVWNGALTLANRRNATNEAIGRVEKNAADSITRVEKDGETKRNELAERVTRLEEKVGNALTKDDLADLYSIARNTESDVSHIKGELKGLVAATRDLNASLVQRGLDK